MKSFKQFSLACVIAVVMLQGQGVVLAQEADSAKAAAATDEASLRKKLAGTWELDYGGLAVTFVFSDKDVNVMNMGASPYELKGDQLSFEVMGKGSVGKLAFTNDKEMILDGAEGKQVFKRVQ